MLGGMILRNGVERFAGALSLADQALCGVILARVWRAKNPGTGRATCTGVRTCGEGWSGEDAGFLARGSHARGNDRIVHDG